MKIRIFALLLCLVLLLTGCGKKDKNEGYQNPEEQGTTADLGDDNKSFGESLDGDVYFRTEYPGHNLVRARNQFKLVKDISEKEEELKAVVKKIVENI